ncbi:MAG: hypothetical protein PWP27_2001 [Clostridiales bacterium]|nr:hypothetical protein [Clostridiales bacterium]
MGLSVIDYLFLYSLLSTWLLLLMNIFLTFSGYRFYIASLSKKIDILKEMTEFPSVSILIPAHNEEKVIDKTVKAMLSLNYPEDKLEVIVINDNSSDNTGKILEELKKTYSNKNLKIITTDKITGGKGKSNALNIGYKNSKGDYIVVYDADNTPEKLALRYLVYSITNSKGLGARYKFYH